MGNCNSFDSTNVSTAKLILQDGKLVEYPYPVKVSQVLQKNPACFICNSDEMDFDEFISAVNAEEELQPGQLYFALPMSRLRHKLQAQDMAALAVKASSALGNGGGGGEFEKCGGGGGGRKTGVVPITFTERKIAATVGGGGGGVVGKRRRDRRRGGSGGGGGGRGRDFTSELSAIEE